MKVGRKEHLQVIGSTPESEADLVELARVDSEAFGVLYDRYVRHIYRYIYYRTGNVADAEDLTEKTFFQALSNLDRYQARGVPFSAWLFRIAHNLVANWHRDTRRRPKVPLDDPAVASHSTVDPVTLAEMQEEHNELRRIIARLPQERQQLLFLKFVEELPNAEIGQIMRRSEGAIKALLHRTIVSMRNEMMHTRHKKERNEPRVDKRHTVAGR